MVSLLLRKLKLVQNDCHVEAPGTWGMLEGPKKFRRVHFGSFPMSIHFMLLLALLTDDFRPLPKEGCRPSRGLRPLLKDSGGGGGLRSPPSHWTDVGPLLNTSKLQSSSLEGGVKTKRHYQHSKLHCAPGTNCRFNFTGL